MAKKMHDLELFHFVGESDILTGRHTEWLDGETLLSVTAASSHPLKVEVDTPGIINVENATILGQVTLPGQASFVLYRVIGGKKNDRVLVTVNLECTDANRIDVVKCLITIIG